MPAYDPAITAMQAEARIRAAEVRATATPVAGLVFARCGSYFKPGVDVGKLVSAANAARSGAYRARTDAWVEAFGGAYRLALPPAHMEELQAKCGCGIMEVYGRVKRGFVADRGASRAMCVETVRHALIGGGVAVVDSAERHIGPHDAAAIVDGPLDAMPLDDVRRLALAALESRVEGREPSAAERHATLAAGEPVAHVVPAWARDAAGAA